jgi:hypothetical protein
MKPMRAQLERNRSISGNWGCLGMTEIAVGIIVVAGMPLPNRLHQQLCRALASISECLELEWIIASNNAGAAWIGGHNAICCRVPVLGERLRVLLNHLSRVRPLAFPLVLLAKQRHVLFDLTFNFGEGRLDARANVGRLAGSMQSAGGE